MRKEKWERDYEKFDEQKALQELLEDKQRLAAYRKNAAKNIQTNVNPRELKAKIDKEERLSKNIKQVGNIIEYKNKLYEEQEKLKPMLSEIAKAERIVLSRDNGNKALDKKLEEIRKKQEEIEEKLKDKNLSESEKSSLRASYANYQVDAKKNNELVVRNLNEKEDAKAVISKYGNHSYAELSEKYDDIGKKIGKCHLAGRTLMAGGSWELITVKSAEEFGIKSKSSTSKTGPSKSGSKPEPQPQPQPEPKKKNMIQRAVERARMQRQYDKENPSAKVILAQQTDKAMKSKKDSEKDTNLPTDVSKFAQKHPKLATFFNKIKKLFTPKTKTKSTEKDDKTEPDKSSTNNVQQNSEEQRDEFIDYLRNVAEKGYEQADKDIVAENERTKYKQKMEARSRAQAQLNKNKKNAYAKRAKKDAEYKADQGR